jgi:hypothetical protein
MNRIEGDCFSEDEEDGRLAEAFKGFAEDAPRR